MRPVQCLCIVLAVLLSALLAARHVVSDLVLQRQLRIQTLIVRKQQQQIRRQQPSEECSRASARSLRARSSHAAAVRICIILRGNHAEDRLCKYATILRVYNTTGIKCRLFGIFGYRIFGQNKNFGIFGYIGMFGGPIHDLNTDNFGMIIV